MKYLRNLMKTWQRATNYNCPVCSQECQRNLCGVCGHCANKGWYVTFNGCLILDND